MAPSLDLESYTFIPPTDTLSVSAQAQPSDLEVLLKPILYTPDLKGRLAELVDDFTNRGGTPEIPGWPRDPGRPLNYYRTCLINATAVGRGFSLLCAGAVPEPKASATLDHAGSLPSELLLEIHENYLHNLEQRTRIWDLVSDILAKGLFSSIEPEPGARYAAGIILLTAGRAIKGWQCLDAKVKDWVPWMGHYHQSNATWRWKDMVEALMQTEQLPRQNTHGGQCFRRIQEVEDPFDAKYRHVSAELLGVLDLAREHIREGRQDLTSKEVMALFLGGLDETVNETDPNALAPGE